MNDATVLPAHGRLSPNLKPAGFYECPHVCNCSLRHVAAIPVMARVPPKRQERRIIENTAATAIIMAAPLITVPKLFATPSTMPSWPPWYACVLEALVPRKESSTPPCSAGLRRGVLPSSWPSHRRTKGLYSSVYSTFSVPAVRLSASGQRLTSKTCYQHTPGPLAHGICLQGREFTRIAVNSVRGETA